MSSKSPRKTTVIHKKRFNLYTRPTSDYETSNHGMSPRTVPLARGFALYFDDYQGIVSEGTIFVINNNLPGHYSQLNTQPLWMGSAMILDEPNRSSETASIDLAGDEVSDTIKLAGSNGTYRIRRWTSSMSFQN